MTFAVAVLSQITDAMIDGTNVPEADHPTWSAAVPYEVKDRRIKISTHLIYECVLDHSNKDPEDPDNIGVYWVVVGPTNRWRPFDKTLSVACTKSGDITYRFLLGNAVNTLGLLGVAGGEVAVDLINTNTTRKNLQERSEDFENAYWTRDRTNLGTNIARDPWGSYQAEALVEDGSNNTHLLTAGNHAYVAGTNYTYFKFLRRGVGTRNAELRLPAAAFPGGPAGQFDLGAGTAGTMTDCTGGILPVPDRPGWYLCWINATADASVSDYAGRVAMLNGTTASYAGDASSSIYIGGSQLQVGPLLSLDDYQWIRNALTFGYRVYNQVRTLAAGTAGAVVNTVFDNIPGDAGDLLGVAILRGGVGDTVVSEICLGFTYDLGVLHEPSSNEPQDFSLKKRDPDFGTVTFIRRNSADLASYSFYFPKTERGGKRRFIDYIKSSTQLWYETEDLNDQYGLMILGYWTRYPAPMPIGPRVHATIEIEGMT